MSFHTVTPTLSPSSTSLLLNLTAGDTDVQVNLLAGVLPQEITTLKGQVATLQRTISIQFETYRSSEKYMLHTLTVSAFRAGSPGILLGIGEPFSNPTPRQILGNIKTHHCPSITLYIGHLQLRDQWTITFNWALRESSLVQSIKQCWELRKDTGTWPCDSTEDLVRCMMEMCGFCGPRTELFGRLV